MRNIRSRMNAIILSIGDELVLGQTVDTNSAWISQQLASVGCDVLAHRTVADDRAAIAVAIREETGRTDVLIVSGGIGPTEDDLTREALGDASGAPLELNQAWAEQLRAFFKKLGRVMPERNLVQAMVPSGAEIIWNHNGTAPGLKAKIGQCAIFVMPGVPKEMKAMFSRDILPTIAEKSSGAVILQSTLHTFGVGESSIAERLGSLMMRQRNPSVGTTVAGGIVSLRINARFASLAQAQVELDQTVWQCETALGDIIFGRDAQTLADVMAGLLTQLKVTVATAESCTGGLIAKMLTDIAGSSAYFRQGWITYSNESKISQLGVKAGTIEKFGAVSEQVVAEMARGARERSDADAGLSVSGVAGPDGGTEGKPVGTVCIGLSHAQGEIARTFVFPGDREWVRDRSAKMALTLLRYHLLGQSCPF